MAQSNYFPMHLFEKNTAAKLKSKAIKGHLLKEMTHFFSKVHFMKHHFVLRLIKKLNFDNLSESIIIIL